MCKIVNKNIAKGVEVENMSDVAKKCLLKLLDLNQSQKVAW